MNTQLAEKPLKMLEQLWRVDGKLVNSKNEVVFTEMPKFWTTTYEGQQAPVGAVVQLSRTRYYLVKS
jgi:hypothetical protein